MRIVRLEVIPIALPFREIYRTASGELSARSMALVRVHTDGEHVGLGEAVPLSLRGGPSLGDVSAELTEGCGPALAGADASPPLRRDASTTRAWIWELLGRCRAQRVGLQALSAIDIALHDLAGKIGAMPLWRLLGATAAHDVVCNAALDAGDPAETAARTGELAGLGFETFKVKVGTGADRSRIAAVREALPAGAHLRIDANGAWEAGQAVAELSALQQYGIELAEQPCATLSELAQVRARTPIPIVADESVADLDDARLAVGSRACDAATLKLAKVGGPLEAIRIAGAIPAYLSSALDGPIGIAAALHVAQALPRAGYAGALAHGLGTLEMFSAGYAPSDGLFGPLLPPPAAPGLGVEIDEGMLAEVKL